MWATNIPPSSTVHAAFEATFAVQDSAKGASVAKNAEISVKLNEMNALKSTITHLVENYCSVTPVPAPPGTPPPTSKLPQKRKHPQHRRLEKVAHAAFFVSMSLWSSPFL